MPRRQQPRKVNVLLFLDLGDRFVGTEVRFFLGNRKDEDIDQGQDDRKPDEVSEPGSGFPAEASGSPCKAF
jgi:hypothetical protein